MSKEIICKCLTDMSKNRFKLSGLVLAREDLFIGDRLAGEAVRLPDSILVGEEGFYLFDALCRDTDTCLRDEL